MTAAKVSAVITNYETWDLTTRCIANLATHCGSDLAEIVVVDDASTSRPTQDLGDRVRIISNNENLGYAKSVNLGIRQCCSPYVLLMDSDAYAVSNLAQGVSRAFDASPNLGAMGFALVDENGRPTGAASSEPSTLGFVLGQRLEWLAAARNTAIHSCAMGMRRSAFDAVGGFDEDFDFLDADIDFSMQLRAAGWALTMNLDYRAIHAGGGSPQRTDARVLRYHRNRLRLLKKHRGEEIARYLVPSLFLRHCTEILVLLPLLPWSRFQRKLPARVRLARGVWQGYET